MNSAALKYFHEVARSGSIAAACKRLHVASSAVSRKIAALEHEVGAKLFERLPGGMVLTDAGLKLAEYVKLSMLEEQRVLADIRSRGQKSASIVKIATNQGLASDFLPRAACLYRLRQPDVCFQVLAVPSTKLTASVIDGDVDLAIAHLAGKDSRLTVKFRLAVQTSVILSARHPLGMRRHIALKELSDYAVVKSADSVIAELIEQRAAVQGIELDFVYESNYRDGPFGYCAQSDAVTFASAICAAHWMRRGELVAIPLTPPEQLECTIEIVTLTGRKLPLYVDNWIDFLIARFPAQGTGNSEASDVSR